MCTTEIPLCESWCCCLNIIKYIVCWFRTEFIAIVFAFYENCMAFHPYEAKCPSISYKHNDNDTLQYEVWTSPSEHNDNTFKIQWRNRDLLIFLPLWIHKKNSGKKLSLLHFCIPSHKIKALHRQFRFTIQQQIKLVCVLKEWFIIWDRLSI